ncbi:MAG: hypothetical protein M0Z79_03830 [Nitrospiraceae bacterium]|nr:hypothetical protein [Nitrospiraceae bacterium]
MKAPLVIVIGVVAVMLGLLVVYSQTGHPQKMASAGQGAAGGYGAAPAAGGYGAGAAPAAGGYGAAPAAGGYGAGAAPAAGGYGAAPAAAPAGGYGK